MISTRGLVNIDPLLLDGSNYYEWRTRVFYVFRTMGPKIE